jgi:hypothetical protein
MSGIKKREVQANFGSKKVDAMSLMLTPKALLEASNTGLPASALRLGLIL